MTSPGPATRVRLVATPEASAGVLYGMHEVFAAVGTMWHALTGKPSDVGRMVPEIVADSAETFRSAGGLSVSPDCTFSEAGPSDIVIVPDLQMTPDSRIDFSAATLAWLQQQHAGGAVMCSVCTGSILLAEAGLLDGLEATTHWAAAPLFESRYPAVRLRPECILLPAGPEHRIVTSGGSASWSDLLLYLVARFTSREEARRIAKVFLFGDRSDGQLPFATLARPIQHDDPVIADCQVWIAANYERSNPVASLVARSGLAPRTFVRRFKRATGYAPIEYIQTLRIEEAKQLLEASDAAIEDVALAVGYDDSSSFRRLFKRLTGISPRVYRQRFQAPGSQGILTEGQLVH